MSIVKTVRRAGRAAGRYLDAEDRAVIGQGLVLFGAASAVIVGGSAVLATAIVVFRAITGG